MMTSHHARQGCVATGLALALALLVASPAAAGPRDDAARVLALFDHEPSVLEVQNAAARYAQVHPGAYDAWLDQAAWAHILPDKVEGKVRRTDDDDIDIRAVLNTGEANPEQNTLQVRDEQMMLELKVRWNLSKLLFNPQKLKAARDVSKLVERREDVLTTVNKLYFARRELQATAVLQPPETVKDMIKTELRLASLTADIDALTGGWFSEEVNRRARSAKPAASFKVKPKARPAPAPEPEPEPDQPPPATDPDPGE